MRERGIERTKRCFTSTVALVTSYFNGISNVMAAEWSLRVSLDPYLVAVFIGLERGSLELVRKSGEFGLNYCSEEQAELSSIAGNVSLKALKGGGSKWDMAPFKLFRAAKISAPLVEGCISNLECRVEDEFKTGDHIAFVGRVVEGYSDMSRRPLIYHGGRYFSLGDRIGRR